MKKLFLVTIFMMSGIWSAFAETTTGTTSNEVLPDFTEESVPVLNQTIRKLQTDIKTVQSEITTFTPSVSNALSGSVVQVVNTETGAVSSGSTAIPSDTTKPLVGEGNQYMSLAITPTSATNKLKITTVFNYSANGSTQQIMALFTPATDESIAVATQWTSSVDKMSNMTLTHYMTAATTSSITFSLRAGDSAGGTITFNGVGAAQKFNGAFSSSMTIEEIKV